MFSDPNTALMVLIILNFAGTLLMFLFVLRSQDNTQKVLLEQYSHMQIRLVELEQRIAEQGLAAKGNGPEKPASLFGGGDDLAAMLENHAAKMQSPAPARPSAQPAQRPGAPAHSGASLPDLLNMDAPVETKRAAPARPASSPLDIKLG